MLPTSCNWLSLRRFQQAKPGIQSWQSSWNTCSRNILNMEWNILKGKTIPRNINIISCILCIPFWFYFATNPAWLPNRCQTCSIMKRPEALSMSLKRPNILQTHHHVLGITFHRSDSCHTPPGLWTDEPSEDSTYISQWSSKRFHNSRGWYLFWWKMMWYKCFSDIFLGCFFRGCRGFQWSLVVVEQAGTFGLSSEVPGVGFSSIPFGSQVHVDLQSIAK